MTRIIFVVLAVPALFALALFLPFMNHIALAAVVLAVTVGSALELRKLIEPSSGIGRSITATVLAGLPPVVVFAARLHVTDRGLASLWLAPLCAAMVAGFIIAAIPMAFSSKADSIQNSLYRSGSNALYLFYPGAFSSAIMVILSAPRESGRLLVWFALIVFANDSLAWLAGVTLGKHRGIFAVSPNKSLEGLIAGMAGSVIAALCGPLLVPSLVQPQWLRLGLLGLVCGLAVVTGDLFESALKRSAGVKDSGAIVPGRGGVLDSFDSILFSAPVFVAISAALGYIA